MCLIIKSGCKIEIAEKSIPVYKIVDDTGDRKFLWNKTWKAFLMGTRHRYNQLLTACPHLIIEGNDMINTGFHALLENCCLDTGFRYAIIPRGAEYCLGIEHEIVANQIIVFSSRKKFEKYINKSK